MSFKSRIFIHAGLHKTGTSAIQHFLANNARFLESGGLYYPPPDSVDAHHQLVTALSPRAQKPAEAFGWFKQRISKFLEDARSRNCDLLLSSECLSEGVRIEDFCHFCALHEVHLVLFIRRQDLLVESVYGQLLKQIGRVEEDIVKRPAYQLDFARHILNWTHCVPEERIHLRQYHSTSNAGSILIDEFLSIFGLHVSTEARTTHELINSSLGLIEALTLERVLREAPIDDSAMIRELRESLSRMLPITDMPIVGNYLTLDERKTIEARYLDTNESIRIRHFPEKGRLFAPLNEHQTVDRMTYEKLSSELAKALLRDL